MLFCIQLPVVSRFCKYISKEGAQHTRRLRSESIGHALTGPGLLFQVVSRLSHACSLPARD